MYSTAICDGTRWIDTLKYYKLGESLAHYREPRHLATTTAAEVWRARAEDGSALVIKIGRPGYEWTVESESAWLHRVSGADNVVQLRHFGGQGRFLVEEYVKGLSLSELAIGSGDLRSSLIAEILLQLQTGLAAIHRIGGVHSDLSLRNAILSPNGRTTVIDLGLCTRWGEYVDGKRGTPGYSAPEQLKTEGFLPTKSADYYSLAAIGRALYSPEEPTYDRRSDSTGYIIGRQRCEPIQVPKNAPSWLEYLILGFGGVRPEDRRGDSLKLRESVFQAGRMAREYIGAAMSLVRPIESNSDDGEDCLSESSPYVDKDTIAEQRGGPPIMSSGAPPMLVGHA